MEIIGGGGFGVKMREKITGVNKEVDYLGGKRIDYETPNKRGLCAFL